jgi:nucleoside-diphosphate-sugar epimerase
MRVLVLGGTGSIGAPVLRGLVARSHDVIALARSESSAAKIIGFGATPLRGDIGTPEQWIGKLPPLDAVVQLACDFGSAMAAVERRLLDGLLPQLASAPTRPKFIYTGGCWLFGATGGAVATEQSPLRPLPAFAWMTQHLERVLATDGIDAIVIHPAMVYEASDGVFRSFVADGVRRGLIRVVGSEQVRWPLVHREDLASLYLLALERGAAGASYIGAALNGFPVGRIARAIARRLALPNVTPEVITADAIAAQLGEWARGRAMDQQLSGERARRELGWQPLHLDPEAEIAATSIVEIDSWQNS